MSFYITFKKKTLACGSQKGHMWVTSGLLYGSVGEVAQHFQPCFKVLDSYLRDDIIVVCMSHVDLYTCTPSENINPNLEYASLLHISSQNTYSK